MTIVVSRLEMAPSDKGYRLSAAVAIDGGARRLTFACTGPAPRLAEAEPAFDPFAAALLAPAMERGEDLVIEGDIDEILLGALKNGAQMALAQINRAWRLVRVDAGARRETRPPDFSRGAMLGMSCGVDSLAAHRLFPDAEATPEQFRIKTMTHNNVGAHVSRAAFLIHRDNANRYADAAGAAFVSVEADLDPFHRSRFIKSHTMRNVAAALSVGHLFHTFLYASSYHIGAGHSSPRYSGNGAVEMLLLPALSSRRHDYRVAGYEWSRVEKVEALLDSAAAQRHLATCTREPPASGKINCGRCWKCGSFLIQAEMAGRPDAFAATFDLDAYRENRSHAWFRLLRHAIGDRRLETDLELLDAVLQKESAAPAWIKVFRPIVAWQARDGRPPRRPTPLPPANAANSGDRAP